MKRFLTAVSLAVLTVSGALAQDATQQQIDKLSGQIQDLLAAQERQTKQMAAIEKEIYDLREKVNAPAANADTASRDDLKKLAEQVQEIDKNRQADRKLILKEIEKLGKVAGGGGAISTRKQSPKDEETADSGPATPQNGYNYVVQPGNTVAAIAKAYQEQGVKVSVDDILKANPKLNPAKLYVGQKIFIPDPKAK